MQAAQREGQLFVKDGRDPGALWHRQDVRATMLANVDHDTAGSVFDDINRRAAKYYRSLSGPGSSFAKTEELYHLLRINTDEVELISRWSETSGSKLRSSINEFPPEARKLLRRMLNSVRLSDVLVNTDLGGFLYDPAKSLDTAEIDPSVDSRELRTFYSRELQSGSSTSFIIKQWEAEGRRLDVAMGDVYASALVRAGRQSEVLELAPTVLNELGRNKAYASSQYSVICIAAAILEGRGALGASLSYWSSAVAKYEDIDSPLVSFSCLLGFVRVSRKARGGIDVTDAERRSALRFMLRLSEDVIDRPVMSREVVAELGKALYQGAVAERRILESLVSRLVETNEVFPSQTIDATRRMEIRSNLGLVGLGSSVSDINSSVLSHLFGGAKRQSKLVRELRREVDWQLARNAWPK
jgi:hypothetical protein